MPLAKDLYEDITSRITSGDIDELATWRKRKRLGFARVDCFEPSGGTPTHFAVINTECGKLSYQEVRKENTTQVDDYEWNQTLKFLNAALTHNNLYLAKASIVTDEKGSFGGVFQGDLYRELYKSKKK